MSDDAEKSAFIKAVTSEGSLFVYRAITGLGAIYLSWVVTSMLTDSRAMREDLKILKYDVGMEIAGIKGRQEVMGSRIDGLSARMTNTDSAVQMIGNRLYDMIKEGQNSGRRP